MGEDIVGDINDGSDGDLDVKDEVAPAKNGAVVDGIGLNDSDKTDCGIDLDIEKEEEGDIVSGMGSVERREEPCVSVTDVAICDTRFDQVAAG